jgi:hypothetical protein
MEDFLLHGREGGDDDEGDEAVLEEGFFLFAAF